MAFFNGPLVVVLSYVFVSSSSILTLGSSRLIRRNAYPDPDSTTDCLSPLAYHCTRVSPTMSKHTPINHVTRSLCVSIIIRIDRKRKTPEDDADSAEPLIDADADRAKSKRRLKSPPPRHHVDMMEDDDDEEGDGVKSEKEGEILVVLIMSMSK